ncbi:DUF4190 domain-containing protein [Leucobacter sp. NPDC077196]|uniref:DUF4190 domain-containing protein n=1 Tax=Leucobacter sp. NPDC077196 TaxID=3154959 RepID=UPI00341971DE
MTYPAPPPNQYENNEPHTYAPPPSPGCTAPRTNTMSIIAFVGSFLLSFSGIILGAIALHQIKRTREQGRGLAIAAIIIGSVGAAIAVIWSAFMMVLMFSDVLAPSNDPTWDSPPSISSDPYSYGDDVHLDRLWDECEAGDDDACWDLFIESPWGSEYEQFGRNDGRLDSTD